MPDLTIRQGDTTPAMAATILDQNGAAVNLTGASVKFVMRSLASAAPVVNAAATVVSAGAGTVQYNWSSVDTAAAGLYMAEFHVTFSGGSTYTYPNVGYLDIEVAESLLSPSQQLVTVADAKDVLNFRTANREHDTKILRWINACRPVIEGLAGPIIPVQVEEWRDGGHYSVTLKRRPSSALGTTPILELNACSEYLGPIEWPLAIISSPDQGQLYSCMLDVPARRIVRRTAGGGVQAFPPMPQSVHYVYTAGQSSVPDNVYEATLELLRVNYQQTAQAARRNARGSSAEDSLPAPPTGFFVPNRVREMIGVSRRYPSLA